ncbi:MAG: phosphoenolpyruvate--protein phosphotransferase [Candidatus Hydrothermales bacterium]
MRTKIKTKIFQGIPASKGVVIGKVKKFDLKILKISDQEVKNKREELEKFERAKREITRELELVLEHFRGSYRRIIESEILIINDPVIEDYVKNYIEKGYSAQMAFIESMKTFLAKLEQSDSLVFKQRAREINHLIRKVLEVIHGKPSLIDAEQGTVIVSDDISPIDVFSISRQTDIGIVIEHGGPTSHSIIVAKNLKIPTVCAVKDITEFAKDGDEIILDGWSGKVILNPDEESKREYQRKPLLYTEALDKIIKGPKTGKGKERKRVSVMGNAASLDEVEEIVRNKGFGVGLFRTELLMWDPTVWYNEDKLAEIFERGSKMVFPDPLIIRLIDIAGEPTIPGFEEKNPFLGLRGIRFLLFEKEIMKKMMRSILKASNLGNIRILLPLVSTLKEVEETRNVLEKAKKELTREDIPFDNYINVGIMVETPASALMVKEFTPIVDFFSIGTNDLTQYTLAVDRTHPLLAPLYSEFHPSVLNLVNHVVKGAHPYRKKVAVCGEMASDPLGAIILMGLGVDELSVHPDAIPLLYGVFQWLEYKKVKEFARKTLEMPDSKTVKEKTIEFIRKNIPPLGIFYE